MCIYACVTTVLLFFGEFGVQLYIYTPEYDIYKTLIQRHKVCSIAPPSARKRKEKTAK